MSNLTIKYATAAIIALLYVAVAGCAGSAGTSTPLAQNTTLSGSAVDPVVIRAIADSAYMTFENTSLVPGSVHLLAQPENGGHVYTYQFTTADGQVHTGNVTVTNGTAALNTVDGDPTLWCCVDDVQ